MSSKIVLPSALFEDYHIYKLSTATVIKWLIVHGDSTLQGNVCVGRLVLAARQARRKGSKVPDEVYKAFVDGISKRERINKWFIQKEVGRRRKGEKSECSEKHVYFLERFHEAFSILFPEHELKREEKSIIGRLRVGSDGRHEPSNCFELLNNLDLEENDRDDDMCESLTESFSQLNRSTILDLTSDIPVLEDDPVEHYIHDVKIFHELHDICATVMTFWKDASNKTLPLPIATWLTNIAYGEMKKLADTLYSSDPKLVFVDDFLERFDSNSLENSSKSADTLIKLGQSILRPYPALKYWLGKHKGKNHNKSQMRHLWLEDMTFEEEDITKNITKVSNCDEPSVRKDYLFFVTILGNLSQLLTLGTEEYGANEDSSESEEDLIKLVELYSPEKVSKLVDDMRKLSLATKITTSVGVLSSNLMNRLSVGLWLSFESSRIFFENRWNDMGNTCHLEVLNVAKRVRESNNIPTLDNIPFSCQFAVHHEEGFFNAFLASDQSMMIYHTPWSAGQQICSILHRTANAGLWLCTEGEGRVQVILHAYNALRQLGFMSSIPILDDLCQVFLRDTFLGALPTSNFKSSFARCMGASLVFKPVQQEEKEGEEDEHSHKERPTRRPKRKQIPKKPLRQSPKQSNHEQKQVQTPTQKQQKNKKTGDIHQVKPALTQPVCLMENFDTYKPFAINAKGPLFYQLLVNNFVSMTDDRWIRLLSNKNISLLSQREINEIARNLRTEPFTKILLKIRDSILDEFTGPLPVARLQYTRIYLLCIEALSKAGHDFAHRCEGSPEMKRLSVYDVGFLFMDIVIDCLDLVSEPENDITLRIWPTIQKVRQALQDTFGDKKLTDYLWEV